MKTRLLPHLFIAICLFGICEVAFCQEPDQRPTKAIESYAKGDYVAAEAALLEFLKRRERSVIAWHYLALTYEKLGNVTQTISAHENAARIGEQALLQLVKANKNGEYIEALRPVIEPIQLAAVSCGQYSTLDKSRGRNDEWAERCLLLDDFSYVLSSAGPIYKGKDVTTKARLVSKPPPDYTPAGIGGTVRGRVILRAVFSADGRVRAIVPVQSIDEKVTTNVVNTARRIVFKPATRDGLPVSMWMVLEYNFDVY